MRPSLVCFFVIAFVYSRSSSGQVVRDITELCLDGEKISEYLTQGIGYSDVISFLLATPRKIECLVEVSSKNGTFLLVVFEFIDWIRGKDHCVKDYNVIKLKESTGGNETNICKRVKMNSRLYRVLSSSRAEIGIKGDNMDTIKIIVTSVREPEETKCIHKTEIECPFENDIYCMTKKVLCDDILNCGLEEMADEDKDICTISGTMTLEMVTFGLAIVFVTCALGVALLRNLLPKRKGMFIFKEDETLSDKDRDIIQKQYEISMRIYYDPQKQASSEVMMTEESRQMVQNRRLSFRRIVG